MEKEAQFQPNIQTVRLAKSKREVTDKHGSELYRNLNMALGISSGLWGETFASHSSHKSTELDTHSEFTLHSEFKLLQEFWVATE